ncbi:hypothetical protein A1D31_22455 [Bradyrhizobium liaoningense]|nr:hypothetical protein A1D31_22455 [Bradyrhizobium liaoningense]
MIALAVVQALLSFELLDGREVLINPIHIVSLSETAEDRDPKDKLLTDKAHCVVSLSNGKFISVAETCDSIRRRVEHEEVR